MKSSTAAPPRASSRRASTRRGNSEHDRQGAHGRDRGDGVPRAGTGAAIGNRVPGKDPGKNGTDLWRNGASGSVGRPEPMVRDTTRSVPHVLDEPLADEVRA